MFQRDADRLRDTRDHSERVRQQEAAIWHAQGDPAPGERIFNHGRDVSLDHPSTWPAWFDRNNYVENGWRPWLRPSERGHTWPDPETVVVGERPIRSRGGRRSRMGRG